MEIQHKEKYDCWVLTDIAYSINMDRRMRMIIDWIKCLVQNSETAIENKGLRDIWSHGLNHWLNNILFTGSSKFNL